MQRFLDNLSDSAFEVWACWLCLHHLRGGDELLNSVSRSPFSHTRVWSASFGVIGLTRESKLDILDI